MRPNCLKHRLKIESKLSHVYQSLVRCIKNTGKQFFLLRDVLYYKDSVIIKYMVVFDYFFFFCFQRWKKLLVIIESYTLYTD